MKILVTGSTGLLGRYIVAAFHGKGHQVRAMVRSSTPEWMKNLNGVEAVEGDVEIPETLSDLVEGVDQVIHCAAVVSLQARDHDKVMHVNVGGTRNIVNTCLNARIPRLLHVSSVAAIGHDNPSGVYDEQTPWSEASGFYAQSKYDAELEVYRGMAEGLHAVIVNPAVVLAPDDHSTSSGRLVRYARSGTWFYTDGKVNLVDVRDVAEAVLRLAEHGEMKSGDRFILSAGNLSWKAFLGGMASRCGKSRPFLALPRSLVRMAMRLSGLPASQADSAFNLHSYDASRIKSAVGLSFRPLTETMDWVCAKP